MVARFSLADLRRPLGRESVSEELIRSEMYLRAIAAESGL